ncbi:hypothetical protein L596_025086 [Steinernema carpocapsae]|uniref:Uncharacterized protein n=1 Tax=Steinernema carpocapsae TaxID=34508 RepID=A0A4U5M6S0_STECR|nr:hypothetical protein L596_025086 [Steinernema carpocapsae]
MAQGNASHSAPPALEDLFENEEPLYILGRTVFPIQNYVKEIYLYTFIAILTMIAFLAQAIAGFCETVAKKKYERRKNRPISLVISRAFIKERNKLVQRYMMVKKAEYEYKPKVPKDFVYVGEKNQNQKATKEKKPSTNP